VVSRNKSNDKKRVSGVMVEKNGEHMKVVAINGSARKDGNTAQLMTMVFDELDKAGIECEMVQLAGKTIRGCTACYNCFKNKDKL